MVQLRHLSKMAENQFMDRNHHSLATQLHVQLKYHLNSKSAEGRREGEKLNMCRKRVKGDRGNRLTKKKKKKDKEIGFLHLKLQHCFLIPALSKHFLLLFPINQAVSAHQFPASSHFKRERTSLGMIKW